MADPQLMDRAFQRIMRSLVDTGRAPHHAELARALGLPAEQGAPLLRDVMAAYPIGWLHPETDYIASFPPLNNLPTQYRITVGGEQRWFLVAMAERKVVGFLIGEVRDWEFGSPPCGWVFAINVDPAARQDGIGTRLLESLSSALRSTGVAKLRTLLHHDNTLILSFFRSQGMMAAPLIPLEMDVAPVAPGELSGEAAR